MVSLITMDKKWETKDHRKVRLLTIDTDPTDAFPVIGFAYSPRVNGSEYLQRWSRHGAALYTEEDDTCDLVPVPTKHEGWILVSKVGQILAVSTIYEIIAIDSQPFRGETVHKIVWED